ncbi:MAG TPA: carboxylesterase/lipase family protein [Kofleriaceae bacterium]|nr:carboxylesterase/lipase family protein [Kofleriaceae bacterium]
MAELIVETLQGSVRGELRGAVRVWKGIPYAAPPLGALRFRPPAPPVAWQGERDATAFGSVAAQSRDSRVALMSGITEKVISGEDCLVLNVFAPRDGAPDAGTGTGAWPVMVWIHGGAFIMGSGSTPLYSGIPFAEQGIVVVTINYRLGLPGLLYLGDVAPGGDRAEGNYGLLDQIAALAWVRDNIAAFGGDPGAVTVMGESAGAISIAHLLAMPAARGLFHRAILESGASALSPSTRADATRLTHAVLAQLGIDPGTGTGTGTGTGAADALAALPIDQLLAAQDHVTETLGITAYGPYIDGVTVPGSPVELVRAGSADGIPLLLGSNRDEWTFFELFLGDVTVEGFKPVLRQRLGAQIDALLEVYRSARPDQSEARAWVDLIGDAVFGIPVVRLAEAQAGRGAPVFLYRFDWRSPAFGGRLGAAHALELPFVWNRLDLQLSQLLLGDQLPHAQGLATQIHLAWVSFIKTGDPNGGGLPAWPRYDAERRATMLLDRASQVADDPAGATRAAWPTSYDP